MPRRHVHITLPPDLHDRARSVVDRLPGATLTGLIEDLLSETIPVLDELLDAAEAGDEQAMRAVLSGMLGDKLVHIMLGEGVSET